MRILWYNWRDIKNPDAGGAEVFTHEVAKRLIAQQKIESITVFTSTFEGALAEETIEGVRIVRRCHKSTMYRKAREFYQRNKNDFDLVIDEINTKPFDTPSFVRGKPIIAIIHQLAREFWFYETKFPLNIIGYYIMENYWLRKYRNIPTITVSNSTKDDLVKLGFKNIAIVPEGISFEPLNELAKKEQVPTLLFVGRLTRAKKPDDALRAFKIIKDEIRNARLWIAGEGYMSTKLRQEAVGLFGRERVTEESQVTGISAWDVIADDKAAPGASDPRLSDGKPNSFKDVTFFGKLENVKKLEVMSRAHLLLVPGVREGWGLVVTEANAMGTPAVAYDVPGLRDSVVNGVTGKLVTASSPDALATASIDLLKDSRKLQSYSTNALQATKDYSWNNTAKQLEEIICAVRASSQNAVP